jgi:hypothetical protein
MVEADGAGGPVRLALSARFQDLIDAIAMREGATDTEAYLEGWSHDAEAERTGSAEEVASAVAAELEAGFADLARRRLTGL